MTQKAKEQSNRDALLWEQQNLISQSYDYEEGDGIGKLFVFYYLKDGTSFSVDVNYENYPKKVIIKLPAELQEFLDKRKEKLKTIEEWNPDKPVIVVLDEIQRKIHSLHLMMNEEGSEKDKIKGLVLDLRKYTSKIILAYEHIYSTTELISEEG